MIRSSTVDSASLEDQTHFFSFLEEELGKAGTPKIMIEKIGSAWRDSYLELSQKETVAIALLFTGCLLRKIHNCWEINRVKLQGEGSHGAVYSLEGLPADAQPLCVKIAKSKDNPTQEKRVERCQRILEEKAILEKIHKEGKVEGIIDAPLDCVYSYQPQSEKMLLNFPIGFLGKYYPNGDFSKLLREKSVRNLQITVSGAVLIMNRLIEANQKLRERGLYNLDLKTSNMLVREDGYVDMTDLSVYDVAIDQQKYSYTSNYSLADCILTLDEPREAFAEQEQKTKKKEALERLLIFQLGVVAYFCFYGKHDAPYKYEFRTFSEGEKGWFPLLPTVSVPRNAVVPEEIRLCIRNMLLGTTLHSYEQVMDEWKRFKSLYSTGSHENPLGISSSDLEVNSLQSA
jgi:serine/threonine protein kinase